MIISCPGTVAILVGTGKFLDDQSSHDFSDVPLKGKVIIRSYEDCKKDPEYRPKWPRTYLCSFRNETHGPCDGDAGSPLFVWQDADADGKRKILVQVGHAVETSGSNRPNRCTASAFIYTGLSQYVGWIHRRVSGCGNYPYNTQRYPGQTTYRRPPRTTTVPSLWQSHY